jgi:flagellar biosynthesis/type III secretory pathway M-ring protein FliF/YscJ
MQISKIAIMILCACSLLAACETDRYANQSTVTVTESEDPELRKALIQKLNAVNFDYELTKDGDIRFPKKNQPEFDAILAQVTQERQGSAAN